jgi:hypothetical protein
MPTAGRGHGDAVEAWRLEEADDSDDPKAALVALLMEVEAPAQQMPGPEGGDQLGQTRALNRTLVSRAFPSWKRSILTEIYLCHACSYHETEDGNARAGAEGDGAAPGMPRAQGGAGEADRAGEASQVCTD